MPDSGDCSDAEMNQPSCSRKVVQNKNSTDREKKNRRIIMRIEFNDSDDSDADDACSVASNDNEKDASMAVDVEVDLGTRPSCSTVSQLRRSNRTNRRQQLPHTKTDAYLSGDPSRRSARQFRSRRFQNDNEPNSGSSSSGSEV